MHPLFLIVNEGASHSCAEGLTKDKPVSAGEDGEKPSRCRHCKRGATLPSRHCGRYFVGRCREATSRESGDPTDREPHPLRVKGRLSCRCFAVRW
jgi:hypothetical protein